MKKLFMGTAFAMICGVALTFTTSVKADEAVKYASVKDNTQKDSLVNETDFGNLNPTIDITNQGEEITVTYDAAKLTVVKEDEGLGRDAGYAWIGLRMTAPTNAEYCKVKGSDKATKITDGIFDEYFGVSEEKLKASVQDESNAIVYNYEITWYKADPSTEPVAEGNTISTQKIKVIIKSKGVELHNDLVDDEDKTLWNQEIYQNEVNKVEEAKKAAESNEQATQPKAEELDSTPKTGVVDNSVYALIAISLVSVCGVFAVRKFVK